VVSASRSICLLATSTSKLQLKRGEIVSTEVSVEELQQARLYRNVTSLEIHPCAVKAATLDQLHTLPNLTHLTIEQTATQRCDCS
jgi:hypothetical protein